MWLALDGKPCTLKFEPHHTQMLIMFQQRELMNKLQCLVFNEDQIGSSCYDVFASSLMHQQVLDDCTQELSVAVACSESFDPLEILQCALEANSPSCQGLIHADLVEEVSARRRQRRHGCHHPPPPPHHGPPHGHHGPPPHPPMNENWDHHDHHMGSNYHMNRPPVDPPVVDCRMPWEDEKRGIPNCMFAPRFQPHHGMPPLSVLFVLGMVLVAVKARSRFYPPPPPPSYEADGFVKMDRAEAGLIKQ